MSNERSKSEEIFTAQEILDLNPCWIANGQTDLLRSLAGEGVTAMQIATDERVSIADREWVLTNLMARGPRPDLKRLIAWSCDQSAKSMPNLPADLRAICEGVLDTVRRWIKGETVDLSAAWSAAWRVADSAAWSAARSAARSAASAASAAWSAADSAASAASAASSAADSAAWSAASAAWSAARLESLIDLANMFGGMS